MQSAGTLRRWATAMAVAALLAAAVGRAAAATVTVTASKAPVKDGKKTIALVAKGQTLPVVRTQGDWYGVRVSVAGKVVVGWVHRSHVSTGDGAADLEAEAERDLAQRKAKAETLAAAGRLDEALALLDAFPQRFWKTPVQRKVRELALALEAKHRAPPSPRQRPEPTPKPSPKPTPGKQTASRQAGADLAERKAKAIARFKAGKLDEALKVINDRPFTLYNAKQNYELAELGRLMEDERKPLADDVAARLTAQDCFARGQKARGRREKIAWLARAIKRDPDYWEAIRERGKAFARLGPPAPAPQDMKPYQVRERLDYGRLITLRPNDPEGHVLMADWWLRRSGPRSALSQYERAIRLDPKYAPAYVGRGIVHRRQGHWGPAQSDFNHAIALDTRCTEAYFHRAILFYKTRRRDRALMDYDRVLELDPRHVGAHVNRALLYARLGRVDDALRGHSRAIELDPDCAEAYLGRSIARVGKGDNDGALRDCIQAIRLDPQNPKAHQGLALLCLAKENKAKAVRALDEAARLAPNDPRTHQTRGEILALFGDHARAAAAYTKAIELRPGDAVAYSQRGSAYGKLKKFDKALADHEKAIALAPVAVCYAGRGFTYLDMRKPDLAVRDFSRAIELQPNLPGNYAHRAMAYLAAGREAEARADIEKADRLPGFVDPTLMKRLRKALGAQPGGKHLF